MASTLARELQGTGAGDPSIALGALVLDVRHGVLRLVFDGIEVVRQIDCPIRDADWRTLATDDLDGGRDVLPGNARLHRRFRTADGSLEGDMRIAACAAPNGATVDVDLTLTVLRESLFNRAGFVLLHPIADVAGTALTVRHADGSVEDTRFPTLVSPGQPVLDIAGLRHRVAGIDVTIDMQGEVFEMEDQRNWTDASFKTYCRPLSRPRPFRLAPGETVRQSLRIALSGSAQRPPAAAAAGTEVRMPDILLAHEPALTGRVAPDGLSRLGAAGVILRVDARAPDFTGTIPAPLTLEIVADMPGDIADIARGCDEAGLRPRRVIALPRPYLASHQPEGPWPAPRPMDLLPAVRAAFPDAQAGGGVLTNFTEFNRCRPDPAAIDFATFGTTAIVHAADDRSVRETLEAFAAVLASARRIAGSRPLHLGLVSIGMRSNPYGSATAPNPDGLRLAMAMDDPRQHTRFAGAFAFGAAAEVARGGAASFAPAMTAGPLGVGEAGTPLFEAVTALAAVSGETVRIEGGPGGLLVIRGSDRTLAANLGPSAATFDGRELASMDFAL